MSYRSGQDPEENLPDWLKDLRKRQSQESGQQKGAENTGPESSEDKPSEEEPSWLGEIRERYGRPEPKPTSSSPDESESALSDTQPITPKPAVSEPEEETEPAQEPFVVEPAIDRQQGEPAKRKFPDWLEELGEPKGTGERVDEQGGPQIPAFTEGTVEGLAPGELPSWLQAMRPAGVFPKEDTRSSQILPGAQENAGPLAGLSGVLPAEPEAIQSKKPPVYSTHLELTDSHSRHVAELETLLAEEDKAKEGVSYQAPLPARVLNALMGVALTMAVLFPILTRSRLAPRPEAEMLPASEVVFTLIEALPAGAPVLIGFDLQPALYGESKAVVIAVISHLLEKQAQLVFISTQPTGPALAENVMHDVSANNSTAVSGYTNLGYLSGGMAALRSFLSDPRGATVSSTALGLDPWDTPALAPINSVSDFALVVVVSSEADDARIWIEQGVTELPIGMLAITSAQAAPLLRSYLQSTPQTLRGLVSGLQGAVVYERLRSQENEERRSQWDAYSFGLGAIVLFVLLGGLYGRVLQTQRGNPVSGSKHSSSDTETSGK